MGIPELDHALGTAGSVLLDSSALLAFYTAHERVHPLAKHLLGRIEQDLDPLEAWCATVTLMELLVRPTMAGPQVAGAMLTSLTQFPHLHVAPVDQFIAVQAASGRMGGNRSCLSRHGGQRGRVTVSHIHATIVSL